MFSPAKVILQQCCNHVHTWLSTLLTWFCCGFWTCLTTVLTTVWLADTSYCFGSWSWLYDDFLAWIQMCLTIMDLYSSVDTQPLFAIMQPALLTELGYCGTAVRLLVVMSSFCLPLSCREAHHCCTLAEILTAQYLWSIAKTIYDQQVATFNTRYSLLM